MFVKQSMRLSASVESTPLPRVETPSFGNLDHPYFYTATAIKVSLRPGDVLGRRNNTEVEALPAKQSGAEIASPQPQRVLSLKSIHRR